MSGCSVVWLLSFFPLPTLTVNTRMVDGTGAKIQIKFLLLPNTAV